MVLPVRARLSGVQEWTPEYPIKFYTRLVRAVHFERFWSDEQGKWLLFIIILEVQLQWMEKMIKGCAAAEWSTALLGSK